MQRSVIDLAKVHGYRAEPTKINIKGARLAAVRVIDPSGNREPVTVQTERELKAWLKGG